RREPLRQTWAAAAGPVLAPPPQAPGGGPRSPAEQCAAASARRQMAATPWADPFACSRRHRQQSPPHARSLTFSAHFGTAVPRSRLSLSTLAAAANASIVSGGHLPALTQRTSTMGYKQTSPHRFGRGSYHQIGLVRGQFGNVPINQW